MTRHLEYTNTSGLESRPDGNARSAGGRMARTANYVALLFSIAMFTIVQSLAGTAFATNQDDSASHETAAWDHGLVCGDHKCAPGEMPHPPPIVSPVKGIK